MLKHVILQSMRGKTINRLLMNASLREFKLHGKVLDLGAGTVRSSYFNFFRKQSEYVVTSVDISAERKPDVVANLEDRLPLKSGEYDFVLCFNLLEHIYHHQQLLIEISRVLKAGGALIGYVPFLVKYHPDPGDYYRYTEMGLHRLFQDTRFSDINIGYIGRGPLTAAWSQMEYLMPRFLRWIVTGAVFGLDALLLKLKSVFRNKYALGYTFIATK